MNFEIAIKKSYKMGRFHLKHRVVMPPLARERCDEPGVPPPEAAICYGQQALDGGLIVAEATAISKNARGFSHAAGIWTSEQIEPWKPVVRAVHDKVAFFFLQFMHVRRTSDANHLDDGKLTISSTSRKLKPLTRVSGVDKAEYAEPKRMEEADFPQVIEEYRAAARNAIKAGNVAIMSALVCINIILKGLNDFTDINAGFDGVEVHGAHGYLLEQFMKNEPNDRTVDYRGFLRDRCCFPLEVLDAVCDEIGRERIGMRLSPFSDHKECVDSRSLEI